MLDKIIRFSIKNKLIIAIFTLALIFWGSYSLKKLPIDAVPDITNNQVQIITTAPSQAAQDIERLVTFPVEQSVTKIPGVEEVRSFSRFGLSVVTVVFKDNIDVYWARQQVAEKLTEAKSQIPAGVGVPELGPVTTGLGEIYQYVIHPKKGYEKKYDAMELRTIQDWLIRRQLLGVPGVADISSFGGYLKQYEVSLDPNKLKGINISIAEVFNALKKNNQNTGGAYIEKKPNAYFIRSEGLIENLQDIEDIVVKNTVNGTPVLIRDIGEVRFGHAIRYGAMTRNADGEMVGGLVLMLKGANASKVIADVKVRIEEIQKTLPEGVSIEPFLDRTKLVNSAIGTVIQNLAEGALIVIFILVLFLGNLRAGLIVASVIPLAMLFAIALMNLFGVSGNLMSLGAIDFGLIVDGAVIIVEATMHHLGLKQINKRLTQNEMDEEVYESASRIRSSAAFGEIIILIVYLPILALVGVEGKMFKPMAQTVSFAILGAFILSLTYVPMMSAWCLSKNIDHKRTISDRLLDFFHRYYNPLINRLLKKPTLVISGAVILLLLSLMVFNRLGAEFLPSLDEGDFAVETRVLTGSGLSETIDAAQKSSKILLERFPDEVKKVVAKIGSAEIPTDPMPIEACDLMVILKDKAEWKKASDKDDLAEKMTKALEEVPGVTFGFQQPIQMRFNELMTGARQDVVIKVYGEDLDLLTSYANKISKIIPSIEGTRDVFVEKATGLPQIVIKYKRDQIAKFGMNIEEINQTINAAFAGQSAGIVYEGEKRFDLVVRLKNENRRTIEDVADLYVSTPTGVQVPLQQVADVSFIVGPNQIQRDDAKRRIIVGFNVRGRDVESIIKELESKIEQQVQFATGYYPTYGGTFENLQEAKGRLSIAVPVALLLILLLLYFTFSSLKQSLLIYTAIPLSAIGGVLALWVRDMPFSISAGVGFIALFGVAVLNGIVLIAEFNRLKKEGVTDVMERIRKGTEIRLRPVIMTAAVASLGFLPMALSHGSGAEVQKPLATVVIGGLITATLLTLIVLPCIYLLAERKMKKISPINPTAVLILGLSLVVFKGNAQSELSSGQAGNDQAQTVTLDKAISIALQNNRNLQAVSIQKEYYEYQKGTSTQLPKTDVTLMYGQYNSFYKKDNNISISQAIPFPTVFTAKNALANSQLKGAELRIASAKNELIYQVKQVYFTLLYLNEQRKLLQKQDSAYQRFTKTSGLRYKTGEATLLEKTASETRLSEIQNRKQQLEADLSIYTMQLQTLLGVSYSISVTDQAFAEKPFNIVLDSSALKSNPNLALMKQQIEISQKERSVVVNSSLPEFKIGYFNQTLYGVPLSDANTSFATPANRFQGIQVGLILPIWFVPEIKKNKASQKQVEVNQRLFESEQLNIQSLYTEAVQNYLKAKNNLTYYSTVALPNADLIFKQSEIAYTSGEIGFAEQALMLQQASSIRQGHINAINEYNQAVIYLEYLTANK
jgi:heavy metal efflux system protein